MSKVFATIVLLLFFSIASSQPIVSTTPLSLTSKDFLTLNGWTLLAMWSLDCVACELDKPKLSQIHKRYDKFNVIGVLTDGKEKLKQIERQLAESPVSFSNNFIDHHNFEEAFERAYQQPFLGTPTYVLYGPSENLIGIHVGPMDFDSLVRLIESR